MDILFLTMSSGLGNINTKGIYTDLMRKFCKEGHNVCIVHPVERRNRQLTGVKSENNLKVLGVKTLNLTKTNVIEKGIGQLLLEYQFNKAINKHFKDIKFDTVLYSTPPITFAKVIKNVQQRNPEVMKYLLLKDIFPQNAVDLGMMSKSGLKGLLYKFFRRKEKELYKVSDFIGCMSPANVEYVLAHNPEISPSKVEIAPNSYEVPHEQLNAFPQDDIRRRYNLPLDKPVFIYGGNMGKPQGIPFLIRCMDAVKDRNDCHFVIVGNGTEYSRLENWYKSTQPKSVSLFQRLPKEEYDMLAHSCDVGLIFLDYRFTIPNYPSRLLSYLMERKPLIAVTDPICDTGKIAEENGYGFYCPSNSVEKFVGTIERMLTSDLKDMGEKGYQFFLENYNVDKTYNAIIKHIK